MSSNLGFFAHRYLRVVPPLTPSVDTTPTNGSSCVYISVVARAGKVFAIGTYDGRIQLLSASPPHSVLRNIDAQNTRVEEICYVRGWEVLMTLEYSDELDKSEVCMYHLQSSSSRCFIGKLPIRNPSKLAACEDTGIVVTFAEGSLSVWQLSHERTTQRKPLLPIKNFDIEPTSLVVHVVHVAVEGPYVAYATKDEARVTRVSCIVHPGDSRLPETNGYSHQNTVPLHPYLKWRRSASSAGLLSSSSKSRRGRDGVRNSLTSFSNSHAQSRHDQTRSSSVAGDATETSAASVPSKSKRRNKSHRHHHHEDAFSISATSASFKAGCMEFVFDSKGNLIQPTTAGNGKESRSSMRTREGAVSRPSYAGPFQDYEHLICAGENLDGGNEGIRRDGEIELQVKYSLEEDNKEELLGERKGRFEGPTRAIGSSKEKFIPQEVASSARSSTPREHANRVTFEATTIVHHCAGGDTIQSVQLISTESHESEMPSSSSLSSSSSNSKRMRSHMAGHDVSTKGLVLMVVTHGRAFLYDLDSSSVVSTYNFGGKISMVKASLPFLYALREDGAIQVYSLWKPQHRFLPMLRKPLLLFSTTISSKPKPQVDETSDVKSSASKPSDTRPGGETDAKERVVLVHQIAVLGSTVCLATGGKESVIARLPSCEFDVRAAHAGSNLSGEKKSKSLALRPRNPFRALTDSSPGIGVSKRNLNCRHPTLALWFLKQRDVGEIAEALSNFALKADSEEAGEKEAEAEQKAETESKSTGADGDAESGLESKSREEKGDKQQMLQLADPKMRLDMLLQSHLMLELAYAQIDLTNVESLGVSALSEAANTSSRPKLSKYTHPLTQSSSLLGASFARVGKEIFTTNPAFAVDMFARSGMNPGDVMDFLAESVGTNISSDPSSLEHTKNSLTTRYITQLLLHPRDAAKAAILTSKQLTDKLIAHIIIHQPKLLGHCIVKTFLLWAPFERNKVIEALEDLLKRSATDTKLNVANNRLALALLHIWGNKFELAKKALHGGDSEVEKGSQGMIAASNQVYVQVRNFLVSRPQLILRWKKDPSMVEFLRCYMPFCLVDVLVALTVLQTSSLSSSPSPPPSSSSLLLSSSSGAGTSQTSASMPSSSASLPVSCSTSGVMPTASTDSKRGDMEEDAACATSPSQASASDFSGFIVRMNLLEAKAILLRDNAEAKKRLNDDETASQSNRKIWRQYLDENQVMLWKYLEAAFGALDSEAWLATDVDGSGSSSGSYRSHRKPEKRRHGSHRYSHRTSSSLRSRREERGNEASQSSGYNNSSMAIIQKQIAEIKREVATALCRWYIDYATDAFHFGQLGPLSAKDREKEDEDTSKPKERQAQSNVGADKVPLVSELFKKSFDRFSSNPFLLWANDLSVPPWVRIMLPLKPQLSDTHQDAYQEGENGGTTSENVLMQDPLSAIPVVPSLAALESKKEKLSNQKHDEPKNVGEKGSSTRSHGADEGIHSNELAKDLTPVILETLQKLLYNCKWVDPEIIHTSLAALGGNEAWTSAMLVLLLPRIGKTAEALDMVLQNHTISLCPYAQMFVADKTKWKEIMQKVWNKLHDTNAITPIEAERKVSDASLSLSERDMDEKANEGTLDYEAQGQHHDLKYRHHDMEDILLETYIGLLKYLSQCLDPEIFLHFLPEDGDARFFLPFIQDSCGRAYTQNTMREMTRLANTL